MKTLNEIKKTPNLKIETEIKAGLIGTYFERHSGKWLRFVFTFDNNWEHLSVSMPSRDPSWEQMCIMKDIFWEDEEECVQFHPKKSEYINCHPHCLHIWRPVDGMIIVPKELGGSNE